MQLTRRSFVLLLFSIILMGLGDLWRGFAWLGLVAVLVISVLMLVDWRLTPNAEVWSLQREHDERLSLATWNRISVHIYLRHSPRSLSIWLRDEVPPTFGIRETDRVLSGSVVGGDVRTLHYRVRPPRRGDYSFGDLHLRWKSVLGLFRQQASFPAAETVKVYPNLVDVRKYDLLVRQNRLWELGLRKARVLGGGTEFERLREYFPDDEYRRINWKATARRGKPISMEFETERSQNLVAMLDIGRMMRSPVGDVARLDFAINAVLLLAFVATQKGDRVGALTFADVVQTWLAPRTGRGQFLRMLETLYSVEGQPVEPDYNRAFQYFSTRQRKRSLVLVFTDFTASFSTDSLVAHMSLLRRRHLPLLITIGDPSIHRLARQPITDSATLYQRTVAEQLLDERKLILERLQRLGVLTLDVPADKLSVAVIDKYLELKSRALI
ncbi:MAG: DUF58 domain-containing protein [Chloroflexi bacterium]|nr:DUF58 domain-containing protein [Chloroflexota bacterium]